jgi:hypothetical protein
VQDHFEKPALGHTFSEVYAVPMESICSDCYAESLGASPIVSLSVGFSAWTVGVPAGFGCRMFRAFDKKTGKIVWEMELPAGVSNSPMTYMVNGKQYILVAVSGRSFPGEYVALSLP